MNLVMDKSLIENLLHRSDQLSDAKLLCVEKLKGDASSRSYARLSLDHPKYPSCILMSLTKERGPVIDGELELTQDDTFVLIQALLKKNGFRVPEIYLDARSEGLLLVEDIGSDPLYKLLSGEIHPELVGADRENFITESYKKAIDLICKIQEIPNDNDSIVYKRSIGLSAMCTESNRFIDFYAAPNGFSKSRLNEIETIIKKLAEDITQHSFVPCYRDFMSWNIHLGGDGELVLIDFQDMLLASYAYDVMTLLHDRDIDLKLGHQRIEDLLQYFESKLPNKRSFRNDYYQVMLQRDLRLAGQFTYLSELKKTDFYVSFVPGCLARIELASKKLFGEDLFKP